MQRSILLLLALLLIAGCQSTDNGQALVAVESPVAFRVGSVTVTTADFQKRMETDIGGAIADLLAQGQTVEQIEQLANESNVRRSIFDRMIQDELLMAYARSQGLGIDPTALDGAIFAQLPEPDPASPFGSLTSQRVAQARNQLVFTVIARNTRADMALVRHILVADAATADQVQSELAAGADFADLAQKYSTDSGSAAAGGDLGWSTRGLFVPEFEEAAFNAPLNTVTRVESQFGIHLIEVLDRAEQRPFDDFEQLQANQNAQQFYEETFLPWYDQYYADAQAAGELQITPGFDPDSVPLPFPTQP